MVKRIAFAIAWLLVAAPPAGAQSSDCQGTVKQFTTAGDIDYWQLPDGPALLFEGSLLIQVDGAPDAYCPPPLKGRDDIANAGEPGDWRSLVLNSKGNPVQQKGGDPTPGCWISETMLQDKSLGKRNPRRYVDSRYIPYVALPGGDRARDFRKAQNLAPGDFAVVYWPRNGKYAFAIFADTGPSKTHGRGSMALARAMGIADTSPITGGHHPHEFLYVLFPGSGDGKPRSKDEIEAAGAALLQAWGGTQRLAACSDVIP